MTDKIEFEHPGFSKSKDVKGNGSSDTISKKKDVKGTVLLTLFRKNKKNILKKGFLKLKWYM